MSLVAELTGAELDMWVAKASRKHFFVFTSGVYLADDPDTAFSPSTNPAQAWPLIDEHSIEIYNDAERGRVAFHRPSKCMQYGPDSLTASMRVFVESKLGHRVGDEDAP